MAQADVRGPQAPQAAPEAPRSVSSSTTRQAWLLKTRALRLETQEMVEMVAREAKEHSGKQEGAGRSRVNTPMARPPLLLLQEGVVDEAATEVVVATLQEVKVDTATARFVIPPFKRKATSPLRLPTREEEDFTEIGKQNLPQAMNVRRSAV